MTPCERSLEPFKDFKVDFDQEYSRIFEKYHYHFFQNLKVFPNHWSKICFEFPSETSFFYGIVPKNAGNQ